MGVQELVVVFLLVILLFGPKRVPEVARLLAKISREIRKAVDEIKREIGGHDDFTG